MTLQMSAIKQTLDPSQALLVLPLISLLIGRSDADDPVTQRLIGAVSGRAKVAKFGTI